jgi:hypothetical protein
VRPADPAGVPRFVLDELVQLGDVAGGDEPLVVSSEVLRVEGDLGVLLVDEPLDSIWWVQLHRLLDPENAPVDLVREPLAQFVGIGEQDPRRPVVVVGRHEDAFGILLAVNVLRVRGPHLRDAEVVLLVEHVDRAAVFGPLENRRQPEGGVAADFSQPFGRFRVMKIQVAGVEVVLGGHVEHPDGLVQRLLGELDAGQAVDDRIAAGHADRHPVGVELVVPRQRQAGHLDEVEN